MESREQLERNTGWEKMLFQSAQVLKQTFPVLMHEVRLDAVPQGHKNKAASRIQRQNKKYHPGLEISKVSWPRWAKRDKSDGTPKWYFSLLVDLTIPEAANEIVKKGMLEKYQLKMCSRYNRVRTLLQYFNCCQYGHISSQCTNNTRCETCAGSHDTRDHPITATNALSCAACEKKRHTAWHPDCKTCQKEKEKAQAKLMGMASRYPVRPRFEHGKSSITDSIILDGEGFQQVTRKKKALRSLTDSAINATASQTKSGKIGKSSTATKLASKESEQQKIQFLSSGNFTEVFGGLEQSMKMPEESASMLVEEMPTSTPSL